MEAEKLNQLPQELQHQLAQLQQMQQQGEALSQQRFQMEVQHKDIEKAIEEIEKLENDAEVYKTVGSILIKKNKNKLEEELKEKNETMDLRVKTLKRQEEKLATRLKEFQEKLQKDFEASGLGGPAQSG